MSTTYLLKQKDEDWSSHLVLATKEDWIRIIRQKSTLPKEQRRYFIKDCIVEKGQVDCIYIEVSYEEYQEWNREHMRRERNRHMGQNYIHLSLENSLYTQANSRQIADDLVDKLNLEEIVLNHIQLLELREKLGKWKPWGPDMLALYLEGKQRQAASIIAAKYQISPQRVREYKRQFENFIKIFLKGVSF